MPANTRDDLYLFSVKGQATRLGVHQVPEGSGSHFADLSGLTRRDRIAALVAVPKSTGDQEGGPLLLLATAQGKVKRVAVADLIDQASADPQVIGLDEGDELLWAGVSPGGGEFLLVTAQGQAIRFAEDEVRSMGLPTGGIGGVKLAAKDRTVAAMAVGKGESAPPHVAVVTALGIGKRVPVGDFPVQGRNGQGVVVARPMPKLGNVAGAALVGPGDTLLCLTAGGGSRPIPAAAVPEMGRPAQGKSVIPLVGGDQVTRIVAVAAEQAKAQAEDKAEVKTEARMRKTTAGAAKATPAGAKKTPAKTAAATKAEAGVRAEAKAQTGAAASRAATGAATSATPPTRTRKTAATQPALLPSEPPASTAKVPAKPAAATRTKPATTAGKAEPAKPATRSMTKPATTGTA